MKLFIKMRYILGQDLVPKSSHEKQKEFPATVKSTEQQQQFEFQSQP